MLDVGVGAITLPIGLVTVPVARMVPSFCSSNPTGVHHNLDMERQASFASTGSGKVRDE